MGFSNNNEIKLIVRDEEGLYNHFSPEDEFDDSVKSYITSKIVDKNSIKGISLTVISQEPMDEDRFRSAVANWISNEKASFRLNERNTLLTLIGALIFGSIMLLLCISLEKIIDVLQYSLMPIMGSLALGKAAGILVEDLPVIKAQNLVFSEMSRYNVITFEYGRDNSNVSSAEN